MGNVGTKPVVYCFLDTTVFIQCIFFEEIDWTQVLAAKSVLLLVAPMVMSELDDHRKDRTSNRVRDRAKKIVRRFTTLGKQVREPEGAVIRPGVRLKMITGEPDMSLYPGLDPRIPDDRIIASALTWSGKVSPARLLSTDLGIVLRVSLQNG